MAFYELLFIAVGLSMDAFAVAVCKGLSMHRLNWGHAAIIALAFGFFQGFMPLIGWLLGNAFEPIIAPIDHWIAFGLMSFIGAKMIWDAFHEDESIEEEQDRLHVGEILLLAVATSIDAFAVGITLALLAVDIWVSVTTIAITTFVLCFIGVVVGNLFGARFDRAATVAGGVVLILIGLHILLEGLGVMSF